jgi:hypothetical protein
MEFVCLFVSGKAKLLLWVFAITSFGPKLQVGTSRNCNVNHAIVTFDEINFMCSLETHFFKSQATVSMSTARLMKEQWAI